MRAYLWAAAAVAAAVLLAGCGSGGSSSTPATTVASPPPKPQPKHRRRAHHKKLQRVRLTLDEHEGPTSAGIIMAAKRGYFADVGLSVWIADPQTPNRPVRYVSDGTVDLGVTHLPEVALAQERGAPVVAVGSLVPQATAAMIWTKDSKIKDMADLRGKTIAITGLPFQERFLDSVLARHGLTRKEVKVKKVSYELVNSLLFGRADAIFGGSWNLEGIELEQLEMKPTITRFRSFGIPAYDELVVIAAKSRIAKEPKMIRKFMSALARGTAAAADDPAAAVEAIEEGDEGNPDATPEITEAETEATLPLLSRNGYMDPNRAKRLGEWMFAQGMLEREPQVSRLLTNRYR
jgi:putative hydroxymethylpyrimidine transport system substrate-binding protein